MKAFLLGAAVLLSAALLARADLIIVQKVEGGGQAGEQTIKIKGDKSRTDLNPSTSMLTDGSTGEMVTLMHNGKTYLTVSLAQMKSMMEQLQKMRTSTEPPKLVATGKKEKVGDYDCEIFTANLGSLTVTYWFAKDFPNYQSVVAQLDKFQSSAISAMGKGIMPDMKDFPGMPMKTEMDLGGKKVVTTIVSAKEENVDPKVFVIPKEYKQITSPALNFEPK
jgi:hypothetical protein